MRNTQQILYKIGKIVNFVLLGLCALGLLGALIGLIVSAVNGNGAGVGSAIGSMIYILIEVALVIVLMVLCNKYEEDAKKAPVDALTPVILLMVFGFLSYNWLYLVGGVFAIIAANQEKNANGESKKEEPAEEKKEEKAE